MKAAQRVIKLSQGQEKGGTRRQILAFRQLGVTERQSGSRPTDLMFGLRPTTNYYCTRWPGGQVEWEGLGGPNGQVPSCLLVYCRSADAAAAAQQRLDCGRRWLALAWHWHWHWPGTGLALALACWGNASAILDTWQIAVDWHTFGAYFRSKNRGRSKSQMPVG